MKVFVTGGTGYLGQIVVEKLLQAGHDVVALQRRNSARPLCAQANLRLVDVNLFDSVALATELNGVDAVIHLVGIIREDPRHAVTMHKMHELATQSVVDAAKSAGISHFVYMSALGARRNATSTYHLTKWCAEQVVRTSGIPYTIFQPSVVFGEGGPGPNFVSMLVDLVKRAPLVPIIGSGESRLQPISIDTLTSATTSALETPDAINRTFEVGGPTILAYTDIMRTIAAAVHKPFHPIHIPLRLMKWSVPVLQNFRAFPLTMDQLTMLEEGNICNNSEPFNQVFQLQPIPFTV